MFLAADGIGASSEKLVIICQALCIDWGYVAGE